MLLIDTYPWKFTYLYSPGKLSITHVLVERSWGKKYPCTAGWNISTILMVSNHCEMLEGVCLAWMPSTTQRTMCLNKLHLCKAALEVWYGSKPIGSSVKSDSMQLWEWQRTLVGSSRYGIVDLVELILKPRHWTRWGSSVSPWNMIVKLWAWLLSYRNQQNHSTAAGGSTGY